MEIIKYNHKLQNKLQIGINNYIKFYNEIEIEIIPIYQNQDKNYFINYQKDNELYFHIYFNDEQNEIKRNYFTKDDNIKKIKIIIDKEIKSFKKLFENCEGIEKNEFYKI